MNSVDVSSQSQEPPSSGKIEQFCRSVLTELRIDGWELSVLLCDDQYIAELNRKYRKKEGPTDVLSFSQSDNPVPEDAPLRSAGDIVISMDSLKRNAREYQVSLESEFKRLLIHGILHLSGMDHGEFTENNDEEKKMMELQEKLMEKFSEDEIL
ncbi:MAG: rRNA maturation RNase YbeY [Spirochaetia bacterium]